MKKLVGIFLAIACVGSVAKAQKLSINKVPVAVKTAFAKLHPNMKADWEMENKDYEAGFLANGKKTTEVYSSNGNLKETEVAIKTSEFPASVMAKVKGLKLTESAKITKADGTIIYEAEVKGKDLLFDANGNPLKH